MTEHEHSSRCAGKGTVDSGSHAPQQVIPLSGTSSKSGVGELHTRLLDAGIPVVVCRPRSDWREGSRESDVLPPKGWANITVEQARKDMALFRPGVDTLAMVGGHGIDVLDIDLKAGADLSDVPPELRGYGLTITPSGGWHVPVPSTGFAKGVLSIGSKHVGDYVGGSKEGGGRMLCYLPGSTRPKYSGGYREAEQWDVDRLIEDEPTDELLYMLKLSPGLKNDPKRPRNGAASSVEVREFLSGASSRVVCAYGSQALQSLLNEGDAAREGGRHDWFGRSITRVVELIKAGCLDTNAVEQVSGKLDEIKPEGGTSVVGYLGWAIANTVPKSGCSTHNPDGVVERTPQQGSMNALELGQLFALEYLCGRFIFVQELGWHSWNGERWGLVSEDVMMAEVRDWIRAELNNYLGGRGRDESVIRAYARYLEPAAARALLKGARAELSINKEVKDLDAHDGLLNCRNGIVDLRTAELLPHDPELLITKSTGVDYVESAHHVDWEKALDALDDSETREWFQSYVGSCASGERNRTNPVLFHRGDGANGKSSVIGGIVGAFGDYSQQVPDKLLMASSGNEHDTLWMTLQGVRLAYVEELPSGHLLPVEKIKKLAETPEITGRPIGGKHVTYETTHTLMVSTNYRPRVTEVDHGTWRRLFMIEYEKTYEGGSADVGLRGRLKFPAQKQAVLAWIVQGARNWYRNGQSLEPVAAPVLSTTKDWQNSSDEIGEFIEANLEFTDRAEDRVEVADLLERFNDGKSISRHWSMNMFGERFKAHPWVKSRGLKMGRNPRKGEKRGYQGVRLMNSLWE